jgi:hypothetical protein
LIVIKYNYAITKKTKLPANIDTKIEKEKERWMNNNKAVGVNTDALYSNYVCLDVTSVSKTWGTR